MWFEARSKLATVRLQSPWNRDTEGNGDLQTDLCPCGEIQMMSHIVESCPLTKLSGGLSRPHSADEDAVLWMTNYGSWHAYEKKTRAGIVKIMWSAKITAAVLKGFFETSLRLQYCTSSSMKMTRLKIDWKYCISNFYQLQIKIDTFIFIDNYHGSSKGIFWLLITSVRLCIKGAAENSCQQKNWYFSAMAYMLAHLQGQICDSCLH